MFHYALLDVDNTLSRGYVALAMMAKERKEGFLRYDTYAKIRELTKRYSGNDMTYGEYMIGLTTLHAEGVKDRYREDLEVCAGMFLSRNFNRLFYDFAKQAISLLRYSGFRVLLVTNEPEYQAAAAYPILGAEGFIATKYGTDDSFERFDGTVTRMLATSKQKLDAVREKIGDAGEITLMMGDSASDARLLREAKYPMLMNTESQALLMEAESKDWFVSDGRHRADIMYYLEDVVVGSVCGT